MILVWDRQFCNSPNWIRINEKEKKKRFLWFKLRNFNVENALVVRQTIADWLTLDLSNQSQFWQLDNSKKNERKPNPTNQLQWPKKDDDSRYYSRLNSHKNRINLNGKLLQQKLRHLSWEKVYNFSGLNNNHRQYSDRISCYRATCVTNKNYFRKKKKCEQTTISCHIKWFYCIGAPSLGRTFIWHEVVWFMRFFGFKAITFPTIQ